MYKLTTVTNITNAGGNVEEFMFDNFNELQDYIEEITQDMNEYNKEAFLYNCAVNKIEEV